MKSGQAKQCATFSLTDRKGEARSLAQQIDLREVDTLLPRPPHPVSAPVLLSPLTALIALIPVCMAFAWGSIGVRLLLTGQTLAGGGLDEPPTKQVGEETLTQRKSMLWRPQDCFPGARSARSSTLRIVNSTPAIKTLILRLTFTYNSSACCR
jgi:hypothetical protein